MHRVKSTKREQPNSREDLPHRLDFMRMSSRLFREILGL
jgi:hypothetical protein